MHCDNLAHAVTILPVHTADNLYGLLHIDSDTDMNRVPSATAKYSVSCLSNQSDTGVAMCCTII